MKPDEDSLFAAHARIETALKTAWAGGLAQSRPLALLLVAFDGGDRAASLEAVETLEGALRVHCGRRRDVVLRRRPDEFLALLPDTPPAGARRVGEQIVEAMRAGPATVSVGVAVSVPDEQHSAIDLLRRSEALRQSAQDRGGDCCLGGGHGTGLPSHPSPFAWLKDRVTGESDAGDRRRRS